MWLESYPVVSLPGIAANKRHSGLSDLEQEAVLTMVATVHCHNGWVMVVIHPHLKCQNESLSA